MTAIQQISKRNLSVEIEGQRIPLPAYVERAASTYLFDKSSLVLKKRCHICKRLFNVEQFIEEKWVDVHDETLYRKIKTGFSSYCTECLDKKKPRQIQKSEVTKITFYLEKELIRILKAKAALEGISNSEYINRLVNKDINATDLTKYLWPK